MEAAVAEIAEKGLAAATVERIAARAGISRASMYRRWPSKEALLYYMADEFSDTFEPTDSGDLRKDLISVFVPLAIQSYGAGPLATLLPTFLAAAAHDEQIRQFVTRHIVSRQSGAVEALRRAQRRGELRSEVDILTTVDMIAGAFTVRSLWMGKQVTAPYVRKVIDHAINGIVAPSA